MKSGYLHLGHGNVLLMDDEQLVRETTAELLQELGYKVVMAHDGAEAIELYCSAREHGTPFDLAILDLTVHNGMGGKECIQRLLEIDPGTKALVSSGYATDPIMAHYHEYGFCGVVAKPFSLSQLMNALDDAIQTKGQGDAGHHT